MPAARSTIAWQRIGASLVTLALVMVTIGFLSWARPVLVPVALAVLCAFLLSPLVLWLQKRRVARVPAVILVTISAGLVISVLRLDLCGASQVTGVSVAYVSGQRNQAEAPTAEPSGSTYHYLDKLVTSRN